MELIKNVFLDIDNLMQMPVVLLSLVLLSGVAAFVDFKTLKIPNKLNVVILIVNTCVFIIGPILAGKEEAWSYASSHLLSGAFLFLLFLGVAIATGFKMAGDIKFVGSFGIALGWIAFPFLGLALIFNLLTNLTVIKLKKKTISNIIPFAPFFFMSFVTIIIAYVSFI